MLLRKECLDTVGLFDEALPSFQDYDMWMRISTRFRFEYLTESLFKYHVHEAKIGTNLEALSRGLAHMLNKYGNTISVLRRNFGYHGYLELGTLYCLKGDAQKGKESYLKAIQLYPFGTKAYLSLCLSFLGAGAVRRAVDVKKGMATACRTTAP